MSSIQVYAVDMGDSGVNKLLKYLRERDLIDGSERYIKINSKLWINRVWLPGSQFPMNAYDLLEGMEVDVSTKLPIILNGSGSFHHLTYGFCRKIVDTFHEPYTIIHIDTHNDGSTVRYRGVDRISPTISCGYFYPRLMADSPYAKAAVFVTGAAKIYSINEGGNVRFLRHGRIENASDAVNIVTENIKTKSVYPSVDLDVLSSESVKTDWFTGSMDINFLIEFLDLLGERKRMIGADICGLKRSGLVGAGPFGLGFNSRSLETYTSIFSSLCQSLEQKT